MMRAFCVLNINWKSLISDFQRNKNFQRKAISAEFFWNGFCSFLNFFFELQRVPSTEISIFHPRCEKKWTIIFFVVTQRLTSWKILNFLVGILYLWVSWWDQCWTFEYVRIEKHMFKNILTFLWTIFIAKNVIIVSKNRNQFFLEKVKNRSWKFRPTCEFSPGLTNCDHVSLCFYPDRSEMVQIHNIET